MNLAGIRHPRIMGSWQNSLITAFGIEEFSWDPRILDPRIGEPACADNRQISE